MHREVYTETRERLEDRMKRNIHYIDRSKNTSLE